MTNPSETEPRHCTVTDRTLAPGEIVEVAEAVASALLCTGGHGFLVGYDPPDWDYYRAARSRPCPA